MGGVLRAGAAQRVWWDGGEGSGIFYHGDAIWWLPIETLSQIFIDHDTAPLGVITNLTSRGDWTQSFSNISFSGGSANVMESDGVALNGDLLRGDLTRGQFTKISVLVDITVDALPLASQGTIVEINPTTAAQRYRLQYDSNYRFRALSSDNIALVGEAINGTGVRQTVGAQWDFTTGEQSLVDSDGYVTTNQFTGVSPSITRIEIGKACIGKVHRLAIIVEG